MPRMLLLVLLAVCAMGTSGCAGYWRDRAADLGDVVTLSTTLGVGAKGRVGPLQAGLGGWGSYVGWRQGQWHSGERSEALELHLLVAGIEYYRPPKSHFSIKRTLAQQEKMLHEHVRDRGSITGHVIFPVVIDNTPPSYWTQIEVVAAFGGGLRVGVNPGEFVDFLLGFVGIDIYGDDVVDPPPESPPAPPTTQGPVNPGIPGFLPPPAPPTVPDDPPQR